MKRSKNLVILAVEESGGGETRDGPGRETAAAEGLQGSQNTMSPPEISRHLRGWCRGRSGGGGWSAMESGGGEHGGWSAVESGNGGAVSCVGGGDWRGRGRCNPFQSWTRCRWRRNPSLA